jgi:hypothetical protein
VATFPYNFGRNPPWTCECNTGYYLPGDCVPYLLYVPPFDVCGTALELGVILGGIAVF